MAGDKQMELLKKLKALAERGEGGEKEGAERKLRELMEKYHVEEEDLDDELIRKCEFRYKSEEQRKLIIQVAYKVIGHVPGVYSYRSGPGSKSIVIIEATEAQRIQISIEFEFFRDLWQQEKKMFFQAFIQKHRLFGTPEPGQENQMELTMEEWLRLKQMQAAMQDKDMVQRLEGSGS